MILLIYAQLIAIASLVIVEKSKLSIYEGIENSIISRLGVFFKSSKVSMLESTYSPLEIGKIERRFSAKI